MIPTLQTFTRALLTPDLSLTTLADARVITDANSMPRLVRTSCFAEAEIEWRGCRWLLSMPLNSAALPRIERTASELRHLNTLHLAEYRILPHEMRWQDAAGEARTTSLVLQLLPPGHSFADALLIEDKATLLAALDTLEEAFRELHFTHNNLKASNLRWSEGRLIPLRYHDARIGEPSKADIAAFEALRSEIAETTVPENPTVSDTRASYSPLRRLEGHLWVGNTYEGLVLVEDETGFGFVDTDNNPVIEALYTWAGDFHEGRAEVEMPTGMGLIDRKGRYVIPPEYEIIEYEPETSIVKVRQNNRWALFDYLGRRLTEFGMKLE